VQSDVDRMESSRSEATGQPAVEAEGKHREGPVGAVAARPGQRAAPEVAAEQAEGRRPRRHVGVPDHRPAGTRQVAASFTKATGHSVFLWLDLRSSLDRETRRSSPFGNNYILSFRPANWG